MRFESRRLGFAVSVAALAATALAGAAWSQPGSVLTEKKISSTQGNLTATIDSADEFGGAIVSLGDLDGPGPSVLAVAVGTIGDDDGGTDRGAVYILFLDDSGAVLSHRKISDTVNLPGSPLDSGDEFGASVAYLGDLDEGGPSVAALAVGVPLDDDSGTDRGAVYILFLNAAGDVLSVRKISDSTNLPGAPLDSGDEFGTASASLGDLDGAGPAVAALAVGAGRDDDGGTDRGAVYVLFLSNTGTVLTVQKISETQGNFTGSPLDALDDFGGALAHIGDLDGAGPSVAALAVGAPFDDDGGTDRGAIYVLFLGSTGTVLSYQKISDTQGNFTAPLVSSDEVGGALCDLGDLDGSDPGVRAMAVGAIGDDAGGASRGAVYVLFLGSTGQVVSHQKISDLDGNFQGILDDNDEFGGSLGALIDLDGAGPSALTMVSGASFDDDGGLDRGALHLLYLKSHPTISIADTTAAEGSEGTSTMSFRVQLSHSTDRDVTVEFATADSAATTIDGDYVAASGVLTFPAGSTTPQAVTVTVNGDLVPEPNETFQVQLQNALGATIADAQGQGTILNDDEGADVDPSAVSEVSLQHVVPNPTQGEVRVGFTLSHTTPLRLSVFDLHGREVVVLAEGFHSSGRYEALWTRSSSRQERPGVFFVRLQTPTGVLVRRFVRID